MRKSQNETNYAQQFAQKRQSQSLLSHESALEAANKLESQYEFTYKNISEVRKALTDEENSKSVIIQKKLNNSSVNDVSQIQFSFDDFDFGKGSEPVHERLSNYGQNLKAKKDMQRRKAEENQNLDHVPEISEAAKNMKRTMPVEQLLMQRQHEVEAKIEEKRQEKERKELNELSSPQILQQSRNIKRSEPAFNRLFELKKQSLDRREQLRKQLVEREMKQVTHKPEINQSSKSIPRSLNTIIAWGKDRDDRITAMRKKKEQLEENQELFNPTINTISERITSQMDRGDSIHDHLLEQHKRKQEEKEKKIKKIMQKELNESVPMISVHSANLQRDEEIFDRLYNVSMEKEMRKRAAIEHQESVIKQSIDPYTGHRLYSPFINPRSSAIVRNEPVENILLKKSEEKRQKLEKTIQREQEEIEEVQKSSKAGAFSLFLAELHEMRTNTSSQERLLKGSKTKPTDSSILDTSASYTFAPQINPNSREIDRQVNGSVPRADILLKKGSEYRQKQAKMKEDLIRGSLSECTFSPRSTSPRRMNSSIVHNTSIAERSSEWIRRIDKKIEQERVERASKEIEECTFKPRLHGKSSPDKNTKQAPAFKSVLQNQDRSKTPPPQPTRSAVTKLKGEARSMTPPPQPTNSKETSRNNRIESKPTQSKPSEKSDKRIPSPKKKTILSQMNLNSTPQKNTPRKVVIEGKENIPDKPAATRQFLSEKTVSSPRVQFQSPKDNSKSNGISGTSKLQKRTKQPLTDLQEEYTRNILETKRGLSARNPQSSPASQKNTKITHRSLSTARPQPGKIQQSIQKPKKPLHKVDQSIPNFTVGTFSESIENLLDSNNTLSQLNALRREQESGEMEAVLREREEERMIHRQDVSFNSSDAYQNINRYQLQEMLRRDMNIGELKLSPEIMQLLKQLGLN